jgi:redox-sensitive bicupin YhaK (pirin superfamily)
MLAGTMEHRDHVGNRGELVAGSVQWMTAGRGIVHSEMPRQTDGLLWGFQLWVNLPARDKMSRPRYQDIRPDRIPEVSLAAGVRARVIAGEASGRTGPVDGVVTRPLYLDVGMAPHARGAFEVPAGHSAFVYVYAGRARLGAADPPRDVAAGQLAVLGEGDHVIASADEAEARLLLVAAQPLREPIARYGPFVMNTRAEILQAVEDYQRGTLLG